MRLSLHINVVAQGRYVKRGVFHGSVAYRATQRRRSNNIDILRLPHRPARLVCSVVSNGEPSESWSTEG